jgi:hypothetical protein
VTGNKPVPLCAASVASRADLLQMGGWKCRSHNTLGVRAERSAVLQLLRTMIRETKRPPALGRGGASLSECPRTGRLANAKSTNWEYGSFCACGRPAKWFPLRLVPHMRLRREKSERLILRFRRKGFFYTPPSSTDHVSPSSGRGLGANTTIRRRGGRRRTAGALAQGRQ